MKNLIRFKDPPRIFPGWVLFVNKILLKIMALTLAGERKKNYIYNR